MKKIGFIGTGAISEAVVTGLLTAAQKPDSVCISPRNAERAQALSEKFDQVTVAADNQAVIDNSDVVCLAVRPQIAKEILEPLNFRSGQTVISFIATISSDDIAQLVSPASKVCRMIPLPPIARHQGSIVISPPSEEVASLFEQLGTLIQVENDEQLIALWTVTALMAPYFQFMHETSAWLTGKGVKNQDACRYMSSIMHALSITAIQDGENGYEELTHEHATPQGINEQAVRELKNLGWYGDVSDVLDLILDRFNGKADFNDTLKPR